MLPQNIRVNYHSHLTMNLDSNESSLIFDPLGQITPLPGFDTPYIYLNFDYNQKIT